MRTVLLLWVEPPRLEGVGAEVDESVVARGFIDVGATGGFPGLSGRYRLLPDEFSRAMVADGSEPVFLHESYRAGLEKWVNSLPDAAAEVTIVGRVRDAVMQLVQTRLANEPDAVSASPTVTTTEPTSRGMAVVGRSVVLHPARRLNQPTRPPAVRRTHRHPDG